MNSLLPDIIVGTFFWLLPSLVPTLKRLVVSAVRLAAVVAGQEVVKDYIDVHFAHANHPRPIQRPPAQP